MGFNAHRREILWITYRQGQWRNSVPSDRFSVQAASLTQHKHLGQRTRTFGEVWNEIPIRYSLRWLWKTRINHIILELNSECEFCALQWSHLALSIHTTLLLSLSIIYSLPIKDLQRPPENCKHGHGSRSMAWQTSESVFTVSVLHMQQVVRACVWSTGQPGRNGFHAFSYLALAVHPHGSDAYRGRQ